MSKHQFNLFTYTTLLTLLSFIVTPATAAILLDSNFESGNFEQYGWRLSGNPPSVTSSGPTCTGNNSLKSVLDYYESPASYRTEVSLTKNGGFPGFKFRKDYWVGFAIYLPGPWAPDKFSETLVQWHGSPDLDLGEKWRNPILALFPHNGTGTWKLKSRSDPRRISVDNNPPRKDRSFDLGPFETNKWTEFVFHIVFSYEGDGVLEVWKDGKKEFRHEGPTAFNDAKSPYLKMGIYKPSWHPKTTYGGVFEVSNRTVYHDDLRIGESFKDVAPNCDSNATTTNTPPSAPPSAPPASQSPPPPSGLRITVE